MNFLSIVPVKVSTVIWLCGVCGFSTHAAFIASPLASGGGTGTRIPFTTGTNVGPSVRYQQVYGASDFTHLGTPFLITQLSFTDALGGGIFLPVSTGMPAQLEFSTTSRSPDALDLSFDDNVGPDCTTVFSGMLILEGSTTFSKHILLQRPFLYDPSLGNLLLDVRVLQTVFQPTRPIPPGFPALLAEERLGDTTSSVYAYDVNAPTAAFASTVGLNTLFEVTPIPEPETLALLIVGVGALVGWSHKCRRTSGRVPSRT